MFGRKALFVLSVLLIVVGGAVFSLVSMQTDNRKAHSSVESLAGKKKDSITIGYSAPGLDSAQVSIMNGLIERSDRKGWKVITANANRDDRIQESQIDYFISLGVDAIVAVPIDSNKIESTIRKARTADIPFYTIDRAPTGVPINMTVLADNFQAGVQSGLAMVESLRKRFGKPEGVVLELQGNLRQNVAQLRHDGFHSVVDSHPAIKTISKETDWQASRFIYALDQTLQETDIDGIYLHSDAVGLPVILPHLKNIGRLHPRENDDHIIITGVDGSAEALRAIADGFVDQASMQPFVDYGIVVEWIEKEFNGLEIQESDVVVPSAPWSPAKVRNTGLGWQLLLSTTSITVDHFRENRLRAKH